MNDLKTERVRPAPAAGESASQPPPRYALRPSIDVAILVLAYVTVTLGTLIRVWGWNRLSLWGDEVATARRLASPSVRLLIDDLRSSPFPPLYYLSLRAWVGIWGLSGATLRALPVVLGLLALPLTWLVWKRLLGGRATRWALIFVALSAYHIAYSQDAKMYAAVWLLSTLSCGAFLQVLCGGGSRRTWLLVYGLSTASLPMVSYVGVAPLGVQALYGLLRVIAHRRLDRGLGLLAAIALMASLPSIIWLPVAWGAASGRVGIAWIPPATVSGAAYESYRLMCAFLTGSMPPTKWPEPFPWTIPLLAGQAAVVLLACGLLAMSLVRVTWRSLRLHTIGEPRITDANARPSPSVITFLALWFLVPVAGALVFSLRVYSLWGIPRFLTAAAPGLLLWLAAATGSLRDRRVEVIIGSSLLAINLAVIAIERNCETRIPWRTIADAIQHTAAPLDLDEQGAIRDLIITWPPDRPFEVEPLEYALRERAQPWSQLRTFFLPLSEARWVGRSFVLLVIGGHRQGTLGGARDPCDRSASDYSFRLVATARVLDQSYTPILSPFSSDEIEVWACIPRSVLERNYRRDPMANTLQYNSAQMGEY